MAGGATTSSRELQANGIAATKVSRAYQSGHDIVLPIAGLYWQDNSERASMVQASFALPGLYRLALHFKNLKRTPRRFVIEHGDHQLQAKVSRLVRFFFRIGPCAC